jgi:hypothetical protein
VDVKQVRAKFERTVLAWSKVSLKPMFGCPCYLADGEMFVILVTNGVVMTEFNPL